LNFNLERVIDDIIFFCFFVGNDFLPALSVLDIAEASIDTLFNIYKETLPEIGDYITENGLIYWDRAEKLINACAKHELGVLHTRMQKIMNFEKKAEAEEAHFFLDGTERIQYFKLKQKRENIILAKKTRLLNKLKTEKLDKTYKKNKKLRKGRELKRMQIDIREMTKVEDKQKFMDNIKYQSNAAKFDFAVLDDQDSEDEDDDDWIESGANRLNQENSEDEEENLRNEYPEREEEIRLEEKPEDDPAEPKQDDEEDKTEDIDENDSVAKETEETIDTTKKPADKQPDDNFYDDIGGEDDDEEEVPIDDDINSDDLSDLALKDINDSDVSEVDIEELRAIESEIEGTLSKEMIVQLKLAEEGRKKNQRFVKNLCEKYKEDPDSAKTYYYKEKLDIDVDSEEGKDMRNEMLRQYLIGMQWVLFYYYRGIQHWGFYYKYHYPPMISDIKDIKDLLDNNTIESFEECKSPNEPFYPYQQLLTILPADSIGRLLPKCYQQFVKNPDFEDYYPLDFEIDLNGRSMPWEAIVLIPFVDELAFLDFEQQLIEEGKLEMTEVEVQRNTRGVTKTFYKEKSLKEYPLPPKEFKKLDFGKTNHVVVEESDYISDKWVGDMFIDSSKTDTSVHSDYPSLHFLSVNKMTLVLNNIRGTRFEIPQIYLEPQDLEPKHVEELVKSTKFEIYIDYPFQHEAFLYSIMTEQMYYDMYTLWLRRDNKGWDMGWRRDTGKDEWTEANRQARHALSHFNMHIHLSDLNVLIGYNRVLGLKWNQRKSVYEKDYSNEVQYVPLEMVQFKRTKDHYLEIQELIDNPIKRFEKLKNCIMLDETYFGLTASIKCPTPDGYVNEKFQYYDVIINSKKEEEKIRDLYFAK
jgi:5'-3' exonuclease